MAVVTSPTLNGLLKWIEEQLTHVVRSNGYVFNLSYSTGDQWWTASIHLVDGKGIKTVGHDSYSAVRYLADRINRQEWHCDAAE